MKRKSSKSWKSFQFYRLSVSSSSSRGSSRVKEVVGWETELMITLGYPNNLPSADWMLTSSCCCLLSLSLCGDCRSIQRWKINRIHWVVVGVYFTNKSNENRSSPQELCKFRPLNPVLNSTAEWVACWLASCLPQTALWVYRMLFLAEAELTMW